MFSRGVWVTSQLSPCLSKGMLPATELPGKCLVSSDSSGKSFWKGKRVWMGAGSSAGSRKEKYPSAFRVFLIIEVAGNTPVLCDIPEESPPAFPQITEHGCFSGTTLCLNP